MIAAPPRHPYPVLAVGLVAAVVFVGLLALAPAYGFHRDELYFVLVGRHPALGYVDQPPLTPLVTAAAAGLLGVEPWAIRILPAAAVAACVLIAGAIARELGGSPRAQVIAAVVLAVSGYLAAGHLASTATLDLLAWALVLWLVARILRGGEDRLWPVVGLVAGIGLENKHLVLFLGAGLAVALAIHRRDLLRTRGPWLALGIAVLLWLPNLAWQASNGWPLLDMAGSISSGNADERAMIIPELLLLGGPLLFPVLLVGLWRLLRDPGLVPFRVLGTSFLVILVAVFLSGGKSYYVAGAWPPLMAAGAIAVDRWAGDRRPRLAVFGAVAAGSLAVVALLVLPVLPVATFAQTPIPDIYAENAEQVGWPELVEAVDGVVDTMPADQRDRAVILTANYGEAGALAVLGPRLGRDLPPVVSGHNGVWELGPPPDGRDVVVLVGRWSPDFYMDTMAGCEPRASIANAPGVANQEQGASVLVCERMIRPWSVAWPDFRHLN